MHGIINTIIFQEKNDIYNINGFIMLTQIFGVN